MNKHGFTLIELSIVLVILGLIVGGIVGGRSLVRSAELQKITAQLNGYKVALNAFRLQYDALPGDFNEATSYWPTAGLTGNGNGNGSIWSWPPPWGSFSEDYLFWQHMQLAGLIDGSFNGKMAGSSPNMEQGGINVPEGPLEGTGFTNFTYFPTFGKQLNNKLIFGKRNLSYGTAYAYWKGVLVPKDAIAIDKKIDDGIADKGSVLGSSGVGNSYSLQTGCTSAHAMVSPSGSYLLSSALAECVLIFPF